MPVSNTRLVERLTLLLQNLRTTPELYNREKWISQYDKKYNKTQLGNDLYQEMTLGLDIHCIKSFDTMGYSLRFSFRFGKSHNNQEISTRDR